MPSDKPTRKTTRQAVAVALRRVDGLVLAVRRPDEPGEELPNIWGLPAVTLLENETAEQGIRRLGTQKLGIELTPLRQLAEGDQQREHYILHMTVYEASPGGEPTLPTRTAKAEVTLYEDADWLPVEALHEAAERGSLCCKLFLEAALSPSPSPTSGRGETTDGWKSGQAL
ncbi:MAG: NUDIX hydrolase [Chloroflexi bacterium]|nr:NUDIX hydrolase [Chloroflexota bacterium]